MLPPQGHLPVPGQFSADDMSAGGRPVLLPSSTTFPPLAPLWTDAVPLISVISMQLTVTATLAVLVTQPFGF